MHGIEILTQHITAHTHNLDNRSEWGREKNVRTSIQMVFNLKYFKLDNAKHFRQIVDNFQWRVCSTE